MGSFPIIDPYPEDGGALLAQGTNDAIESVVDESDSDDFEIDSDVSDEDLLLLKAEIKRTESTKTQRDLAAVTLELQKQHYQRWERYCSFLRKQAMPLLKLCHAGAFKGYLIWYHNQHPRAKRLNTFESVWKGIRQLYYDTHGVAVRDSVGKEVAKYLNGPFCTGHDLIRGSLPKHTVGYNGILGALYYHWIFDTETFPTERDRVQLAFFILLLAYTGSRPGAIVESDIKGIRRTNEALKYKDINLTLVRPRDGAAPLLVMKVRIVLDKGRRHRGEHKTLTLYENCVQPVMCPIVHFLALAFADKAFHPSLVNAGLSVHRLHSFACPGGRPMIEFRFRDTILDTPIFRPSVRGFSGRETDPSRALSSSVIGLWMARLGERAGFPHRLKPYCLRRDIATSLADAGVSQPQLLQILGHRKIETFQKHYQSTDVVVDVQATFLGSTSKSDIIKEIGKLCLRQDPNLPRSLTMDQKLQARNQPELQQLERRRDALTQGLRAQFAKLKDGAATPEFAQRQIVMGQLYRGRARAEKEHFQRVLREFHDTADLNLMVSQLKGKNILVGLRPPVDFVFEERQRLATTLFQETSDSSFAQIVEDLCLLCTRQEQSRSERVSLPQSLILEQNTLGPPATGQGPGMEAEATTEDPVVVESDSLPLSDNTEPCARSTILEGIVVDSPELPITSALRKQTSRRRTCLFCVGDHKRGRTRTFTRTASLRRHYENVHFQYQVGCFICPVPGCQKLIRDRNVFASHAVAIHRNDIGVRAILRESMNRQKKPGELVAFTL